MFGAHAGYQPPHQSGHNPAPPRNGPPPAKKAKNNPIVTRYPPPPGYRGPAQPQGPYQQQPWQQPVPPHIYGQPANPGFHMQSYAQPQLYAHNQWQGYGQQPSIGASQGYYQPPPHIWSAPVPNWQPPPASQSHPAGWQAPSLQHSQTAPPQPWPPASAVSRHNSAPSLTANAGYAGPVDGNGDLLQPASPRGDTGQDLEDQYDEECYFLRHPQAVDPNLSVGELVWYPAMPSRLALPPTYKQAELEKIAPRRSPPLSEDSVSEYFFREKREEALLSIRQTDEWWKVKDDLIFKEFGAKCPSVLAMSDMIEKYKDRPDPTWLQRAPSMTPESEESSDTAEPRGSTAGGAMDVDGSHTTNDNGRSQAESEDGDVLGSLEQVLKQNDTDRSIRHSRANSTTSITSHHSVTPKPLMPVKDRKQEDLLASLGVTGPAKVVYQTPGPAFGPPPPQRDGSVSRGHSRQNSAVSNTGTARAPPPPPPGHPLQYARRPSYQKAGSSGGRPRRNGYSGSRPGSSGSQQSQRTASGSDSGATDEERTPRPRAHRMDSRKRGYEDYGVDDSNGSAERDDDAPPRQRQRYKQPRVNDAYSRRW